MGQKTKNYDLLESYDLRNMLDIGYRALKSSSDNLKASDFFYKKCNLDTFQLPIMKRKENNEEEPF